MDDGKNGTQAMRRIAVHFVGEVQGVGFRWTSRQIADQLHLTGWVHNEWDGSVRMELQGDPSAISQFFGLLQNAYRRYHIDYRIDDLEDIETDPSETGFAVRLH